MSHGHHWERTHLRASMSRFKAAVSDVAALDLESAVRKGDASGVARWGRVCVSSGSIDARTANHAASRIGFLRGPPLMFACYSNEIAAVELLLSSNYDESVVEARATLCMNALSCGEALTAFQQSVLRKEIGCMRALLTLGADSSLIACWPLDAADEPEYDEVSDQFVSDAVSGKTALSIAAAKGHAEVCKLLLATGARIDAEEAAASPTLAPLVRVLRDEHGKARECPVCLDTIYEHADTLITPCAHGPFHSRCLPLDTVRSCPMCRHPLPILSTDAGGEGGDGGAGGDGRGIAAGESEADREWERFFGTRTEIPEGAHAGMLAMGRE